MIELQKRNILGMICGYYLSRFDEQAYENLGFGSQERTHQILGRTLDVPPGSVKNWRDEFDPVHDNSRKGWRNREMLPSRGRTIEALGDLNHDEMFELVQVIIESPSGNTATEVADLIDDADECENSGGGGAYGLRGPTGIKAEKAYMEFHHEEQLPRPGKLIDRRYEQRGFDFEIEGESGTVFVEVKGLAGEEGGITFTEKEWKTACESGEQYFLALVRNVGSEPQVDLYRNPGARFDPQFRARTILQISWAVSGNDL